MFILCVRVCVCVFLRCDACIPVSCLPCVIYTATDLLCFMVHMCAFRSLCVHVLYSKWSVFLNALNASLAGTNTVSATQKWIWCNKGLDDWLN